MKENYDIYEKKNLWFYEKNMYKEKIKTFMKKIRFLWKNIIYIISKKKNRKCMNFKFNH